MNVPAQQQTHAVSLHDLQKMDLPPEVELMGPLFLARSLGMLFGPRGSGKSLLAMLIGYAIAGGKHIDPWGLGCGAVVVYLDGEMRIRGFKERITSLERLNSKAGTRAQAAKNFWIISRDLEGHPIGHIDTEDGQRALDEALPPKVAFIIVDNLSAWTESGGEGSSWQEMKKWLLKMRLQGTAVLMLHHAGKNGAQRGTSAHEDLLDYSIRLSPVASADLDATVFEVEHTKLRDRLPELRKNFEFRVWQDGDILRFSSDPVSAKSDALHEKIRELQKANPAITQAELAIACGKHKSSISRALRAMTLEEAVETAQADQ